MSEGKMIADARTIAVLDSRMAARDKYIAELEAALEEIAAGVVDSGGNRRNHPDATKIARKALDVDIKD